MGTKRRPRWLKRLVNDTAYWAIRGLLGMFRLLPRRLGDSVAVGLGHVMYVLDVRERALAHTHLGMAFGDALGPRERRRIVRGIFGGIARNIADLARMGAMSEEELLASFEAHGMERLTAALAEGRGVLALTCHAGNWEMMGSWFSAKGVPVAAIARRLYDPRLEALLNGLRTGSSIRTLRRGDNTREIIRSLRDGYMIAVLTDQDIPKLKGTFVDFFGMQAWTATAPAVLSLRYDAPMLPIFTYRDARGIHHACIGEPIKIAASGDFETDVNAFTALTAKVTEDFIREHPEQWVWFHQRWKTRPDAKGAK